MLTGWQSRSTCSADISQFLTCCICFQVRPVHVQLISSSVLTIAVFRVAGFVTVIITAETDLTNLTVRHKSHVLSTYWPTAQQMLKVVSAYL